MAGDWIKMRSNIKDDPDVVVMAGRLSMDEYAVVGRLHALWSWLDQHSANGENVRITSAYLDRLTACSGFAEALRTVGWLEGRDGALMFPNFEKHNGETAKARALAKNRMAKARSNDRYAGTVTTVTQNPSPEKRREELDKQQHNARPRDLDDALAFAKGKQGYEESVIRSWFSERDGQGWVKVSGLPITNWKSDLDAWVLREGRNRRNKSESDRDREKTGLTSTQPIRKL